MSAEAEREQLERAWPAEFGAGVRAAFSFFPAEHEPGGYPRGFHRWPLERRDAYFAGFNLGFCERRRLRDEARRHGGRHGR